MEKGPSLERLFLIMNSLNNSGLCNRFRDLADRCYQKNVYTYSGFLSIADISDFHSMEREFSHVPYELFGGYDLSERMILRFGNEETLGYSEDFPITILEISPLMNKFADELNHRDFLGALMNLGIERDVIGDILVESPRAYIFVLDSIVEYIIENLTRIKHTSVMVKAVRDLPAIAIKEPKQETVQIPSERLDVIISKVYKCSRETSIQFFKEGRVFINGRICENNSKILKQSDTITVRGYGKFIYNGYSSLSRKGKLVASVCVY